MAETVKDDERDEELASIIAIYPELSINPHDPHLATIELDVNPSKPLQIAWKDIATISTGHTSNDNALLTQEGSDLSEVRYLPPLQVSLRLPDGYPDVRPPDISIKTQPQWLVESARHRLEDYVRILWEEYGHSLVVFAYLDWLQSEAEVVYGLPQPLLLHKEMRRGIIDYDGWKQRQIFEKGSYHCGVCLDPKPGAACYRMHSCGHIFCIACLQDFYSTAITQGEVDAVKCLDPDCGKAGLTLAERRSQKSRTLHPRELLAIPLSSVDVHRFVNLKLKRMVESDKSTVYCPRQWCQAPARAARFAKFFANTSDLANYPDSDSEDEVHSPENGATEKAASHADERLAICSACAYAFCRRCNRSWHGEHVACRSRVADDKISPEDKASEDWVRMYTSPCPTCETPCQKLFGCNHMICSQCKTHFCYLCSAWLKPADPYRHFNEKGRGCFMRLWDLEEGDRGDENQGQRIEFGGARGLEVAHIRARVEPEPHMRNIQAEPQAGRGDDDARAAREQRGLQRFLEMARNDIEDEWDSDGLEEDLAEQLVILERPR